MKAFTFLCLILLASCSHVNEESKAQYDKKNSFRHGVVPINLQQVPKKVVQIRLDQEAVKRGETLYKGKCYSCHGPKGRGDGPLSKEQTTRVANISKLAKEVPHFKFFVMLSSWKGEMPGWKEVLTEEEISDIESYIVHLSRLEK